MINKEINGLVILEELRYKVGKEPHSRDMLKFRCKCGKIGMAQKRHILSGHTKSCGCKLARNKFKLETKKVPQIDPVSKAYNQYVHDANNRGINFSLTKRQFSKLVQSPCNYCGKQPSRKITFNGEEIYISGIDRVENEKGYEYKNSVSCCTQCNMAKGKQSADEFLTFIDRIYLYQVKKRGVNKFYKFGERLRDEENTEPKTISNSSYGVTHTSDAYQVRLGL